MELPDDVLKIIKEYSQPITRPDWRQGCYYNRQQYNILGRDIPFYYIIFTVFKMAYLNFVNFDDIIIYNYLMNGY